MAKCDHHQDRETIGVCHCGHAICKECIRQQASGLAVGGGRGFNIGCVVCLPHGVKPAPSVADFMERDFKRRASGG